MKTLTLVTMNTLIGSMLLSGCGGSTSQDTKEVLEVPPTINQAKAIEGPLTTNASLNAERYIKNGIYAATYIDNTQETDPPSSITGDPTTASFDTNFSTTNTVEEGVDEADRMEYDGDYLYLATYPQWVEGATTDPSVKVMLRNDDFSLTEIDSIEVEFDTYNVEGLYLHQDRLAVVSNDYPVYMLSDIAIEPWYDNDANIGLSIHDVTDPSDSTNIASMQIEGRLLSTRRIENELYVVSAFTPYIDDLNRSATTDSALLANYNAILSTPASSIMPKLTTGQQSVAMNDINDCYIPAGATPNDGHAQLITVTKINLNEPTDVSSTCLSAYAFMTYTSLDNLYIASTLATNETQFHKIALTDLSYQASGKVDGTINARANPSFRIDEQDDHLRVVSSDYSSGEPVHKLTILNQNGGELQKVSELPNDSNSEAIGKPGEEIYAVRFIEDKAYIVTFETIDPLYVVDLSDQQSPFIAGSIEIPGFSSYLQPLKNGLILGVGQSVDFTQIPQSGAQPTIAPVTGGLKMSLFDARDPANPIELTSLVISNAYTPVEFNYKALTVLESDGAYRFALPIEQWNIILEPGFNTVINSLMLLETDTTVETPELTLVDEIMVPNNDSHYIYSGEDRSVLHGDAVYYIHGNNVWMTNWLENSPVVGPF